MNRHATRSLLSERRRGYPRRLSGIRARSRRSFAFAVVALGIAVDTRAAPKHDLPAAASRDFSPDFTRWSSNSASTLPKGRWEVALFGASRFGASERLELALHPITFFVLPHFEAKWGWTTLGRWRVASRHRVSYPTLFLQVASREGSGGLLPADSDVPQALQLETDLITSFAVTPDHVLSTWSGLAAAPRERAELPLLDFPFLFPRFAALYSLVVPRVGVSAIGRLRGPLWFSAESRLYGLFLDVDEPIATTFAFEQSLAGEYRINQHVAVDLGIRVSHARYPIGLRTHLLPFADVRVGFE